MDGYETDAVGATSETSYREQPDELPLDAAGPQAALDRVRDYQQQALDKSDAMEASVGVITGGLMEVEVKMNWKIQYALDSIPNTIEAIERVVPAMDLELRYCRQIHHFAQLQRRLKQEREDKGEPIEGQAVQAPPPSEEMNS